MQPQWIAIIVSLGLALATIIKSYGYDKRRMEDLEALVKKSLEQSKEHYDHAKDENAHWTKRERDENSKKLDLIVEMLSRRGFGITAP